jgi:hypothetical protein
VTVDQVMASPRCYFQEFQMPGAFYCDGKVAPTGFVDVSAFDRTAFLTELEKLVIQPLEKTSELFRAQPYMTRLYTTMSAREMTLDPNFDLNGDLPDVDNNHVLNLRYTEGCSGDTSGRWQATLRSGQVVHGTGNTWPYDAKAQRMPVNLRIVQMSTAGMGTVVTDNTGAINKVLDAGKPSSGGCTLDPARNPRGLGGLMLLAVAGLMLLAWRRSGRRL